MKSYTVRCVFTETFDVNVTVQARTPEEAKDIAEEQAQDEDRETSRVSTTTISTRIVSAEDIEPEPEEDR